MAYIKHHTYSINQQQDRGPFPWRRNALQRWTNKYWVVTIATSNLLADVDAATSFMAFIVAATNIDLLLAVSGCVTILVAAEKMDVLLYVKIC